jgi:hypothetical protein
VDGNEIKKYSMFAKFVYKLFVRSAILKAIDDPKKTWDDKMMKCLDAVFK